MVTELAPCPMCGSPATIDSTGAAECYGWEWQTVTVECTDTMGKHCGMSVSIQADHSQLAHSWQKMILFWNDLTHSR